MRGEYQSGIRLESGVRAGVKASAGGNHGRDGVGLGVRAEDGGAGDGGAEDGGAGGGGGGPRGGGARGGAGRGAAAERAGARGGGESLPGPGPHPGWLSRRRIRR